MSARNPAHQAAVVRVAILSRWRAPDDPELVQARRVLAVARAEARFNEAAAAALAAAQQLRTLGPAMPEPSGETRAEVPAT